MTDRLRWKTLLSWLKESHGMKVDKEHLLVECRDAPGAGKGLFATQPIIPHAHLFTVPATAMINIRTLSKVYPSLQGHSLSPNQIVSLHLLLHKPPEGGESDDTLFGPYIDTMPRNFDSHPLTWSVGIEVQMKDQGFLQSLLDSLPPSVLSALETLKVRFWDDWRYVREYVMVSNGTDNIITNPKMDTKLFDQENTKTRMDYVWAWLNVNTRCIYYQLDPSSASPSNMTMCPILDFANHAPEGTHIRPVLPSASQLTGLTSGLQRPIRIFGADYTFISNCDEIIPQNTELFLLYGAHSNRRLFVDYGFVNAWKKWDIREGRFNGEIDVQDLVEACFKKKGSLGDMAKSILEQEGYWGDWTLHSAPQPAHPSYRLITALRLLHCKEDDIRNDHLDDWKAAMLGERETISQDNEQDWRQTLLEMCETLSERARVGIEDLDRKASNEHNLPEWYGWALGNIRLLWREELEVASCVSDNIRSGMEF